MCSIFGMSIGNMEMLEDLGIAGETRGTDATGVSVLDDGELNIHKSDDKASEFDWDEVADKGVFWQGHTRATTQGDECYNYNNHPFVDTTESFSLTHNGVIYNDYRLKNQYGLPETKIETDSYVATQLLQYFSYANGENELQLESVKETCEELSGSFALSIMTKDNRLFLLRHKNPLYVAFNGEDLIYASTAEMLSVIKCELGNNPEIGLNSFVANIPEETIYEIDLDKMEIIGKGEFSASSFKSTKNYKGTSYYERSGYYSSKSSKSKSKTSSSKSSTSSKSSSRITKKSNSESVMKTLEEVQFEMDKEDLEQVYLENIYTFLSDTEWKEELDKLQQELGLTDNETDLLNEIREDKKIETSIKCTSAEEVVI